MGKADLHLHSDLGDGLDSPEEILDATVAAGLDVVCLSDHDDIRGSFILRDLAARRGAKVNVVTGIEVTTRGGHLLALFVEDDVPMFRTLPETVIAIHRAWGRPGPRSPARPPTICGRPSRRGRRARRGARGRSASISTASRGSSGDRWCATRTSGPAGASAGPSGPHEDRDRQPLRVPAAG